MIFRDARTHWLLAIYAASTLAVISVVLLTGGNGTAAIVPPQNPSANIYPNQEYNGPCAGLSPAAAACPVGLSALDSDRQVEGIVPMSLPTTFSSLTPQEQGFVLTNLERVDRGQAPIEGLASSLDSLAQSGAQDGKDPSFPTNTGAGGSIVAGSNLFTADELWMYEDGWSGASTINEGCTSPTASECWGHRDIILGNYPSPTLMGAGVSTTAKGGESTADLFVGGDTSDTPYFTWSQVTPFLPVGAFPLSVSEAAAPGATATSWVELWASGEAMSVRTYINGGNGAFSVAPATCTLAAGSSCQVSVAFSPTSVGSAAATLTVSGPNGTQNVTLGGTTNASTSASSSTTTVSTSTTTTSTNTGSIPSRTTSTTQIPPALAPANSGGSTPLSPSANSTSLPLTGIGEGTTWAALAGGLLLVLSIFGRRMYVRSRSTNA